ncbi:hypothetical protein G7Y89_g755 [Cudoniella acicularis]|uniref:Nicotinamide-nucleotide adenylyltransferase n=1 Tax=Cudoniella acicularis TaxID=354080 RepID=A0A8H4WAX1_9HELO|nr:hypothetical protein G7Y89_g755 [Cudoniella acicularis]
MSSPQSRSPHKYRYCSHVTALHHFDSASFCKFSDWLLSDPPETPPSPTKCVLASRNTVPSYPHFPPHQNLSKSSTPSPPPSSTTPPKTLYILDSSFNPPTLAHFQIATNALLHDPLPSNPPKRLILLLATQNADKAAKPAALEQRLCMMEIFARELLSKLPKLNKAEEEIGVDIALTKFPYFVEKAKCIGEDFEGAEQVHLIGYDTLTRLLDTKYYPPKHTLESVAGFLEKHRVLVTYRTDDQWGSRGEQDGFVREIGDGLLDEKGGRKEWVKEGRIVMVEGRKEGEAVISSTKVREAAKGGDREALKELVTEGVGEWIMEEGLYSSDE